MTDVQPEAGRIPVGLRVVIVGPCASGKSTLAANLVALGIDACVSGQEHSEIQTLWNRMNPDVVVALQVDLETLRHRRGVSWSEQLYETQQRRLSEAFSSAHVHIDTAIKSESEARQAVLDFLGSLT